MTAPLTLPAIGAILANVKFPDTKFLVTMEGNAFVLQLQVEGLCNRSGEPLTWRSRKWRLSRHMTKSEVVQTAFLAVLTAAEHEVREQFRYRGVAVFGPHFNVEWLASLASDPRSKDVRPEDGA